jgi:REP element-mobilizing transposase RayT
MPRGPRIDAPGAIHHVTFRGIERRAIFADDLDREALLTRLDRLAILIWFRVFAWVLMPNHVHLVIQTKFGALPQFMARLCTSYALHFNRRHGRAGHVFQNRYWSRPIEDEPDVVVAYVHRNPLRGGLATDATLPGYPWCGHGSLAGTRPRRRFELCAALELGGAPSLLAIIDEECALAGVSRGALIGNVRLHAVSLARRRVVLRALRDAGLAPAEIAETLGIRAATVGQIVRREGETGREARG